MGEPGREMPPLMILCGGQGTRLREVAERIPKPMVPVGGQPIVWHLMRSYAAFGVRRFILCLGYKREAFVDYFMNFHARAADITLDLGDPSNVIYHGDHAHCDWQVTLADTGEMAMTGARVARAAKYLMPKDDSFFLTYGDGLADVDILDLHRYHKQGRRLATITAVQPSSRFGELSLQGDRVVEFQEKSPTAAGFVNGGFMELQREFVSQYLSQHESTVLENEPLRQASRDGQVSAFLHTGFWQCMDTPREFELLNAAWQTGKAPWAQCWDRSDSLAGKATECAESDSSPVTIPLNTHKAA